MLMGYLEVMGRSLSIRSGVQAEPFAASFVPRTREN